MQRALAAVALVLAVAACGDADQREEQPERRVAGVSAHGDTAWELTAHDTLWYQARDDARCTLYEFLRRVRAKPKTQTMSSVKASFRLGGEVEHMWVNVRSLVGDTALRGILANEPVTMRRMKEGDTVVVALRNIDDWYAVDADTLIGGFVLRLMRSQLSPAARASYDSSHYYVVDPDSIARHRFGWRCGEAPN